MEVPVGRAFSTISTPAESRETDAGDDGARWSAHEAQRTANVIRYGRIDRRPFLHCGQRLHGGMWRKHGAPDKPIERTD
jgi:hypothetical protein